MDANKLTEPNFLDWLRNLRIVLKAERIAYVLDEPLPQSLAVDASEEVHSAYQKHLADSEIVGCIMVASMSPELQQQHKAMSAHTIILHLRELFDWQARFERFEVSKLLFSTEMVGGTSLVTHREKMNGYIERLGQLRFVMDHELSIDLILTSLSNSLAQFVLNYRMNNIESTIPELINLLKTVDHLKEGG